MTRNIHRVVPPPPSEDSRGVDVAQIRAQLALAVAERVRIMTEAANALLDLQRHAVGRHGGRV